MGDQRLSSLELLLETFAERSWRRPFSAQDVNRLLNNTTGSHILALGTAQGFFKRGTQGDFQLTEKGVKRTLQLRTGQRIGDETPRDLAGSQFFNPLARPSFEQSSGGFSSFGDDRASNCADDLEADDLDPDGYGGLTSGVHSQNRECCIEDGSQHSQKQECCTDVPCQHSQKQECYTEPLSQTSESRLSTDSQNRESCQPARIREIFEEPIHSQNCESIQAVSEHSQNRECCIQDLSRTRENSLARARVIKNSEGVRRTPYRSLQEDQIETFNTDLDPILDLSVRGRARSKLDTTLSRAENQQAKLCELKRNIRGLVGKPSLHGPNPDHPRMLAFAEAFTEALRTYKGFKRHRLRSFVKPDHHKPENRFYKLYVRGAKLAESVGAEYYAFIKAQFYWFDTKKLRSPKLWEVASPYSVDRWNAYQEGLSARSIQPGTRVVSRVTEVKIPKRIRWARCDSVLRTLMRNYQVTAAVALRVFALRNVDISFDQDWLEAQPVYKQLKAEEQFNGDSQ